MPLTWKTIGNEFSGLSVDPTKAISSAGTGFGDAQETFQRLAENLKKNNTDKALGQIMQAEMDINNPHKSREMAMRLAGLFGGTNTEDILASVGKHQTHKSDLMTDSLNRDKTKLDMQRIKQQMANASRTSSLAARQQEIMDNMRKASIDQANARDKYIQMGLQNNPNVSREVLGMEFDSQIAPDMNSTLRQQYGLSPLDMQGTWYGVQQQEAKDLLKGKMGDQLEAVKKQLESIDKEYGTGGGGSGKTKSGTDINRVMQQADPKLRYEMDDGWFGSGQMKLREKEPPGAKEVKDMVQLLAPYMSDNELIDIVRGSKTKDGSYDTTRMMQNFDKTVRALDQKKIDQAQAERDKALQELLPELRAYLR